MDPHDVGVNDDDVKYKYDQLNDVLQKATQFLSLKEKSINKLKRENEKLSKTKKLKESIVRDGVMKIDQVKMGNVEKLMENKLLQKKVDTISQYKSDMEYFQRKEIEQNKEISVLEKEIELLELNIQKLSLADEVERQRLMEEHKLRIDTVESNQQKELETYERSLNEEDTRTKDLADQIELAKIELNRYNEETNSLSNDNSIFDRNLIELSDQQKKLQSEIEIASNKYKLEIALIDQNMKSSNDKLLKTTKSVSKFQKLITELDSNINHIKYDLEQKAFEINNLLTNEVNINTSINLLRNEINVRNNQINELNSDISLINTKKNSLSMKYSHAIQTQFEHKSEKKELEMKRSQLELNLTHLQSLRQINTSVLQSQYTNQILQQTNQLQYLNLQQNLKETMNQNENNPEESDESDSSSGEDKLYENKQIGAGLPVHQFKNNNSTMNPQNKIDNLRHNNHHSCFLYNLPVINLNPDDYYEVFDPSEVAPDDIAIIINALYYQNKRVLNKAVVKIYKEDFIQTEDTPSFPALYPINSSNDANYNNISTLHDEDDFINYPHHITSVLNRIPDNIDDDNLNRNRYTETNPLHKTDHQNMLFGTHNTKGETNTRRLKGRSGNKKRFKTKNPKYVRPFPLEDSNNDDDYISTDEDHIDLYNNYNNTNIKRSPIELINPIPQPNSPEYLAHKILLQLTNNRNSLSSALYEHTEYLYSECDPYVTNKKSTINNGSLKIIFRVFINYAGKGSLSQLILTYWDSVHLYYESLLSLNPEIVDVDVYKKESKLLKHSLESVWIKKRLYDANVVDNLQNLHHINTDKSDPKYALNHGAFGPHLREYCVRPSDRSRFHLSYKNIVKNFRVDETSVPLDDLIYEMFDLVHILQNNVARKNYHLERTGADRQKLDISFYSAVFNYLRRAFVGPIRERNIGVQVAID